MPPTSPSEHRSIRAHPLALALIERLHEGAHVLEVGTGSRRNADALSACGVDVTSVDNPAATGGRFDAALSTHVLLHGTPERIARALDEIAQLLVPRGAFYATFGSTADRRFGLGDKLGEWTYAEQTGDEKGVAHTFFTAERLRDLLSAHFDVETMEERHVDDVAGTWAHPNEPLHGAMHWFVVAHRRD